MRVTAFCNFALIAAPRLPIGKSFDLLAARQSLHEKMGQNRGKCHRILTPNESLLAFWALHRCAKFHQNRIKIATIGARTERRTYSSTQVIL